MATLSRGLAAKFQPRDEASGAVARADSLGVLEPVADAASEQLRNAAELRLIPA